MSDPLSNLFNKKKVDGSLATVTPAEFDEIRKFVNDENGGANLVYLENSKATPVLSKVFKNGIELTTDNPDYDKDRLMISENPAQDSIQIAKNRHFAHYSVGSWHSPELQLFTPTHEKGSCAYMILDRYPQTYMSFVGIVQADTLWDLPAQREKLIDGAYHAVSLYSGDKERSMMSHPHLGYQFFFGSHCAYQSNVRQYATRNPGKNGHLVSRNYIFGLGSFS